MEKAASAIQLISKQDECDECETFRRDVANDMRSLPAEKRRKAKFAIQKVLFEFHSGNCTCRPPSKRNVWFVYLHNVNC